MLATRQCNTQIGLFKITIRYKTPCGKKWKMKKRTCKMSYKKYEKLTKQPLFEIIRRLLGLKIDVIDYFILKEI